MYVVLFSPELLDKLPVEIRTTIITSTNNLDKTISSLLSSDETDFEKLFGEAVNDFQTAMGQINHIIMVQKDAPIIIKQFYQIVLSSLSQTKDMLNRELHKQEDRVLSKAIEAISIYFGISDSPDVIVLFSIYLNLSVCILALYKILSDKDNVYQNHRTKIINRCIKFTDRLNDGIKVIDYTKKVETKIKDSDTYLSTQQLQKIFAKELSTEELKYILTRLALNHKIMYDKDDSIIWILADNAQIKKALGESITLR